MNLNTLAENASRLGARLQESFSEHTKELNLRGLGSSYFDLTEDKVKNIRKQLESNSDRETLEGLKRLIALISKGRNVSDFFPAVIKNVASQNIEIRKLVYIYLLRHADTDPELALLSINTFQKDLKDPNPLIRSMALRVLSGINNPMIGNIVVLSIKQCAADISPYVRKTAALALIKCYNADGNHLSSIIPILSSLLKDKSPLSIGAVALAFQSVCPTRLDLLHPHYRRLCRTLADVDEWGQVYMLELLTRYARSMLSKPSFKGKDENGLEDIDLDLKLFLDSSKPLFMSRNPAVVLAVSRVFYYLAPRSQHSFIVNPLLRLLSKSKEVERVVLAYIFLISREEPILFSSSYSRFFVRVSDIPVVKHLKVQVLLNLISEENSAIILREFVDYAEDTDESLVSASVHAIGRCARLLPESLQQCLSALHDSLLSNISPDAAVASAVLELKSLVRIGITNNDSQINTNTLPFGSDIIAALAARIDQMKHPSAKAGVLWLVGQYAAIYEEQRATSKSSEVVNWAPDTLRAVAKTFSSETAIVKLQALTLAAKLLCLSSQNQSISLLCRYIFSLARYDLNYDVRDRSRILGSLLSGFTETNELSYVGSNAANSETIDKTGVVLRREQVTLVLFDGKTMNENRDSEQNSGMVGSLDTVLGKSIGLESGRRLPDWLEEGTDSSLRDSEYDHMPSDLVSDKSEIRAISNTATTQRLSSPVVLTPTGEQTLGGTEIKGTSGGRGQWINLDKFYEDESSEEEEEEEEEEKPYEHPDNYLEEVSPDDEDEDEGSEEGSEDEDDLKSIDNNQNMISEKANVMY